MLFFEELVLRSLKASPWIKPVLDSLCRFEVRSHVKNRFFFRKNLTPVCTHVWWKVIWMFEILSTCSFSFGSWTVERALFVVGFTSVLFRDSSCWILRSLIALMSFGSTDVDAVSSPSSFIILFSSIVSIKQDCSFDSVSESHQSLLC